MVYLYILELSIEIFCMIKIIKVYKKPTILKSQNKNTIKNQGFLALI